VSHGRSLSGIGASSSLASSAFIAAQSPRRSSSFASPRVARSKRPSPRAELDCASRSVVASVSKFSPERSRGWYTTLEQ
jgi:hypothetical protein